MKLLTLLAAILALVASAGTTGLTLTSNPNTEVETQDQPVANTSVPLCRCLFDDSLQMNKLECTSSTDADLIFDLVDLVRWDCEFKIIEVSKIDINSISADDFASKPHLQVIHLHSDFIEKIDSNAFRRLKALVNVDLSDNSLLTVDPLLFVHNSQLTSVSLAGNRLMYLKTNAPILESDSITTLDISLCKLTHLSVESFSKLPNLRRLDLSSNNIQHLPVTALQSLPQLNALMIGNNHWRCDCAFKMVVEFARMMDKTDNRARCFSPNKILKTWSTKTADNYCVEQEYEEGVDTTDDSKERVNEITPLDDIPTDVVILVTPRYPEEPADNYYVDLGEIKVYAILTMVGVVVGFVAFVVIIVLLMKNSRTKTPTKVSRSESKSPICRQNSRDSYTEIINGHIYEQIPKLVCERHSCSVNPLCP